MAQTLPPRIAGFEKAPVERDGTGEEQQTQARTE